MNNNNLNLFRHFYYVIYYGNFTRASEKLLISQPALSYSLKKLQENLGYSLIEKDTKNIRLTEKGKALYHALEKSFEILDVALENNNSSYTKINIGTTFDICDEYLLDKIADYNTIYPNVKVNIHILNNDESYKKLSNNLLDIIIQKENQSKKYINFKYDKIRVIENCFIVRSESNIELKKISDLEKYKLIFPTKSIRRNELKKFLELNNLNLNPFYEIGSIRMAEQLCSKVDSIAYVMNKEIYYNEKKFKVFKFNGLPKEEIFAVYNIKHNKYVDEFINILQK